MEGFFACMATVPCVALHTSIHTHNSYIMPVFFGSERHLTIIDASWRKYRKPH
jgi:hypothetical protein